MAIFDQLSDRNIWVINGHLASQQMTGVQRFVHEIVCSLDELIAQDVGAIKRLAFELVMPRCANIKPVLTRIKSRQSHIGRIRSVRSASRRGTRTCRASGTSVRLPSGTALSVFKMPCRTGQPSTFRSRRLPISVAIDRKCCHRGTSTNRNRLRLLF
jgi:hypothetical protein